MNIDLTFARNYTLDTEAWLPSYPGSTPLYYYPGASTTGGHDGLLLEITTGDGMSWLGMFASGASGYSSGVYGCPNGHSICVVSLGRCYFVKADDPQQWREKTESIREARILPDHNMLLLFGDASLIAYGAHGFLWKTESLHCSGMTIEAIDGNILYGKVPVHYWREDHKWLDCEINLVTGRHKGGGG